MNRFIPLAFVIAAAIFACANGHAGDGKASAWKPFLAADAHKELTKRSIAQIEALAKSDAKDAAEKIEVEAALLVGYTLSATKIDDDVLKLRGAGLQAAMAARKRDVKGLAEFGKLAASAAKGAADLKGVKGQLAELQWMMETFRGKAKGGEGLHADLQYHPKLKNLNGTEAFIGAIAGKKLSDENLDKVAKELPNFAYRVAVMGSITHEFAPAKGAGQWQEISVKMRDASIALAEAALKKNADGVFKAAQTLENSCTQCHMVFKKN